MVSSYAFVHAFPYDLLARVSVDDALGVSIVLRTIAAKVIQAVA
jgi:hypothetical protein